jgi:glutamate/tyrosine decarboxylase-like PLP-dependent enzyme
VPKTYGINKMGLVISQNIDQARYLAGLVERTPELQLLAPVPLNIICFRYIPSGMNDEQVDALNREILVRLHETGVAVPSGTMVRGHYALRCAITNHRTRYEDLDILVASTLQLGRSLAREAALAVS